MKTLFAIAAACTLAACATPATNGHTQVAAAGTHYCWQGRLATDGDNLVCNWSPSVKEACDNMGLSTVRKSALASGPERVTMCGNGQWVVGVTAR